MGDRVIAPIVALVALAALTAASPSLADATTSANWSGYAVHRSGVSFRSVQAGWWEPSVSCTPGRQTFSSYWVGLGGYSQSSTAIEQIGTEIDCARDGQTHATAWYELLPAPSVPISLPTHAGDLMAAQVTVKGREVSFALEDVTTKRTFHKSFRAKVLDLSSAEWIVEAPSDCVGAKSCKTLPLADFGKVAFTATDARSATGPWGSIADPRWGSTMISLNPFSKQLTLAHNATALPAEAAPARLAKGGTGFVVSYSTLPVHGGGGLPGLGGALRSVPLSP